MKRHERCFRWLLAHRAIVLAGCGVILGISAFGASRVSVDFTLEQFFPGGGPERERYDRYKVSFPKEDLQISVFWEPAGAVRVDVFRDLERAARLFEEVGLKDVRWLGSVEAAETSRTGGEDVLSVRPLVERDRVDDAYLRTTLARHRTDPLYLGYLWNADQSVFAIHGALEQRDMDDDFRRREIEESLQRGLELLAGNRATFVLSGVPVTRSRVPKMLDQDQRLFVGGGVALCFVILFMFFRHFGQVALALASLVPAYLVTVSLMVLVGKTVTVLTGFIPIIVLVVGGSDIVHLLSHYRRLRAGGRTGEDSTVEAFAALATPCFYTSLTTAIGFASLAGTRIDIIIDFGLFTALAIFLAYGFNMVLLPVLLSLSRAERFDDRGLRAPWIRRIVNAAGTLALSHPWKLLPAFSVAAVVGIELGLSVDVNTYVLDDLKRTSGVRRDLGWIENRGFGIYQVVLFLRQTGDVPLHHPDALTWMRDFQDFADRDPVVVNSYGLPDVLSQLRGAAVDDAETGTLPETMEEASQLLLLAELHEADFFGDVYRRLEGEAQIIMTVRDAGSRAMIPFLRDVDRYLIERPAPVGSAVSTGTVKLVQDYSAHVLRNFVPSLILAIVLIFAVLIHLFRSVKQGLLALIPSLFPLLVLLAVMRVAGFDLKPSTVLVFSIAFGLAVDDTIHIASRLRRALEEGSGVRAATLLGIRQAGPAMLMTTMMVGGGFALLMASRFEVLFLIGLMTLVAAISAVLADLLLFPSMIVVASRAKTQRSRRRRRLEGADREYVESRSHG